MDQIKTGKFIAEMRKEQNLTQRQLADLLSISDKTVSKWECGKGMPDVSLMLPLCEILHITVNGLLTGKRVFENEYQNKAEENMMNLLKENSENKKKTALSVICGFITIIAVISLIIIASLIDMPTAARVAIIIFAIITGISGIAVTVLLDIEGGYYECPYCKSLFVPTVGEYVKGYHTLTKRRLTCHKCGKTGMCRRRIVRK